MCFKVMHFQNWRPNKHLIVGLTVSTVIAVVALVVATASQAAQISSFSAGPRAPAMSTMRTPSYNGGGGSTFRSEPRFQRFNNNTDRVVTGDGKVKGKGKGGRTNVSNTDQGDGRPGHHPPKKPPGLGPIIGTGVAIGTGVVVGTDPAGASPAGTGPAGATPPPGGVAAQRIYITPPGEDRFVKDELVLEFVGVFPPGGIVQVLGRNGLEQIGLQYLALTNTTVVHARITNGRSVRAALPGLGNETTLRFAQPNFLFQPSQQQVTAPPEAAKVTPAMATAAAIPAIGDPAQYALGKLRIGEAHTLATGERVLVAVIDSGIDLSHPELAGAIAGSFDATGKAEPPHQHGTAIAGAIAAHARLMGAAPAAKILAIRAFGASGTSAEATTIAILKGIQYASLQHARIINMSFAGPNDPSLSRELAAAQTKDHTVLIAASGNFGPKSPPQYPAADPNVIAVSATDVDDKIFRASNIGPHIAVAAPGVDILLPSPGNDYRLISGTSFSAAYVSGVVALILQRAPGLSPDAVRNILQSTAKDLGPIGKDPEYGAGLVDAYQAIMAVQANATAEATPPPQGETEQAKAR